MPPKKKKQPPKKKRILTAEGWIRKIMKETGKKRPVKF